MKSRYLLWAIVGCQGLLASSMAAQVPPGSYAVSCYTTTIAGTSGLFFVDRDTGTATRFGNQPPELSGSGWFGPGSGPDFVLVGVDGSVITNASGVSGTPMQVFFLTLAGPSIVGTVRYDVGTRTATGTHGIRAAKALPGGAIAIAISDWIGVPGEPLHGALIGIVDPSVGPPGTPGTVRPVPINPVPPGKISAMTIDADAGTALFSMVTGTGSGELWSVPFPGGGQPTKLVIVTQEVTDLTLDTDGHLLVTSTRGTPLPGLHHVDAQSGAVQRVQTSFFSAYNAIAVDRANGDYLLASLGPLSSLHRVSSSGSFAVQSVGLSLAWDVSGIDMAQTFETYGEDSPGANTYTWAVPNPGGLPRVGNARFSLTIRSQPGWPAASAIGISMAPQVPVLRVAGIKLQIGIGFWPITVPLPGAPAATMPAPIPALPRLIGQQLFFQSFHAEAQGLTTSNGLRITLF